MAAWSKDELPRIAAADDLHIAPLREDRTTLGTPTWIWSVAVDDARYVRAYNGTRSRWYQAAVQQKSAHYGGRSGEGRHLRVGDRPTQRAHR